MDLATSAAQMMSASQTSGDVSSKISNIDTYLSIMNQKRKVALPFASNGGGGAAAASAPVGATFTGGGTEGAKIFGLPVMYVGAGALGLAVLAYFAFAKKGR